MTSNGEGMVHLFVLLTLLAKGRIDSIDEVIWASEAMENRQDNKEQANDGGKAIRSK
jgi:hypothetical protein